MFGLTFLLFGLAGALPLFTGATAVPAEENRVLLIPIEGPIGPATTALVTEGLEKAKTEGFSAAVLRINTPGGLVSATRAINEQILASPVPVIGYVAPSGAHAASAGTYILYATGLAAMAPGTNLGAATPVKMGGIPGSPSTSPDDEPAEDAPNGDTLSRKSQNDAAAYLISLAELHDRNAEWAEQAVRDASSLTAKQALELNVIELVAPDLETLLQQADGQTVLADNRETVLATSGGVVVEHEPGFLIELLALLANPNIAFVLMLIGVYGLIFEFANPGSIGPGIIGAISLILGLYALNQLPLDVTGLALIGLGLALMVAEAFSPSFGILGLGGLASFIFGATILFDTEAPGFQLSWVTILVTAAISAGLLVLVLAYVARSFRTKVVTGAEEMIGAKARVLDWNHGTGHVHAHGERWQATGPQTLLEGDTVTIARLDGLRLWVGEPERSEPRPQTAQPERE